MLNQRHAEARIAREAVAMAGAEKSECNTTARGFYRACQQESRSPGHTRAYEQSCEVRQVMWQTRSLEWVNF